MSLSIDSNTITCWSAFTWGDDDEQDESDEDEDEDVGCLCHHKLTINWIVIILTWYHTERDDVDHKHDQHSVVIIWLQQFTNNELELFLVFSFTRNLIY